MGRLSDFQVMFEGDVEASRLQQMHMWCWQVNEAMRFWLKDNNVSSACRKIGVVLGVNRLAPDVTASADGFRESLGVMIVNGSVSEGCAMGWDGSEEFLVDACMAVLRDCDDKIGVDVEFLAGGLVSLKGKNPVCHALLAVGRDRDHVVEVVYWVHRDQMGAEARVWSARTGWLTKTQRLFGFDGQPHFLEWELPVRKVKLIGNEALLMGGDGLEICRLGLG